MIDRTIPALALAALSDEYRPTEAEILAAIDAMRRILDGATNSNSTAEVLIVQLHRYMREKL